MSSLFSWLKRPKPAAVEPEPDVEVEPVEEPNRPDPVKVGEWQPPELGKEVIVAVSGSSSTSWPSRVIFTVA